MIGKSRGIPIIPEFPKLTEDIHTDVLIFGGWKDSG